MSEEINTVLPSQNELVRQFENAALTLPQVHITTEHVLHGGMYARTIRIPANTMLTGALTSCDNLCIVSGDITVTTDDGARRLTGFHVLPAKAGAKRAGITHADTCWTTLIPTNVATVTEAEDQLTGESDMLQTRRPEIAYEESSAARLSYDAFVARSGFTQDQINAIVQYEGDCIETPSCEVNCYRAASKIHGTGLFANRDIAAGEVIAPGRMGGKRCVAGRWTNHSHAPNARFAAGNGDAEIVLIAMESIGQDCEITVDYATARELSALLEDAE
jgi:hypothetical protein